jgi:peptidoglycan/LPS O-acetylase OafA/YrhL
MSKGLTSFRALAFFAVYLFHINIYGSGHLGFQGGYLGVDAFFVLSGFLLTPILLDMKSSLSRRDFFIHFYGRRALRIFPLYYSYLAVVAVVFFLVISQLRHAETIPADSAKLIDYLGRFINQLPWTMTYTYDFFHASSYYQHTHFATHFWSLAVEEQFYLVWPMAILLIPAAYMKRFLILVIAAGPLIRMLMPVVIGTNMLPILKQNDLVIYVLPFSHLDAFAIGGYLALYGKSRSGYWVWLTIVLVFMLGVITSWLATKQIHWGELGYAPFMKDAYKYVWGYSVINFMFAYILVNIRNKSFLPVLFENPVLVYFGKISYGLYVFHFPVLWVVYVFMHNSPELVRALTVLGATIMISTVSYELMERRFINAKDTYFARTSVTK